MEEYPYRVFAELHDERLPNHQVLRQKLKIYFHNKRKSGGGECFVEFEEKGNSAIIGFMQEEGKFRMSYQVDGSFWGAYPLLIL